LGLTSVTHDRSVRVTSQWQTIFKETGQGRHGPDQHFLVELRDLNP